MLPTMMATIPVASECAMFVVLFPVPSSLYTTTAAAPCRLAAIIFSLKVQFPLLIRAIHGGELSLRLLKGSWPQPMGSELGSVTMPEAPCRGELRPYSPHSQYRFTVLLLTLS